MIAVALAVAWVAYSMGFGGWSLIKGWNLGFKQIISPTGYYTGKWPPAEAGDAVIFPDGSKVSLAKATLTAASSTFPGGNVSPGPQQSGISNSAAIHQAANRAGWGSGTQWNALQNLIASESGGNPNIANPTSGAFGIAQALGHGGQGTACPKNGRNQYGANYGLNRAQAQQANCGNAYYQAIWMMNYIKDRYGTPAAAWSFHQQNNYY